MLGHILIPNPIPVLHPREYYFYLLNSASFSTLIFSPYKKIFCKSGTTATTQFLFFHVYINKLSKSVLFLRPKIIDLQLFQVHLIRHRLISLCPVLDIPQLLRQHNRPRHTIPPIYTHLRDTGVSGTIRFDFLRFSTQVLHPFISDLSK